MNVILLLFYALLDEFMKQPIKKEKNGIKKTFGRQGK